MARGPKFVQFFGPLLEALKDLGGSARPGEVEDWIASNLSVPSEVRDEQLTSGGSRFRNQVHWARFYLAQAGLLDASKRGVWSLTERGRETVLDQSEAMKLFRKIHSRFQTPRDSSQRSRVDPNVDLDSEDSVENRSGYKSKLLTLLSELPPEGFERLCQRILRESGFENVTVTGRSADGGIDGHGVLRVNPLVSFYVYFQCKRYTHPVGSGVVRDFRGAMMGRADKGIILTTAPFTSEARKEAVRDGVPPIELVDGDSLIAMLEQLELGLIPRTTYEVDERFFVEFGHTVADIARNG